MMASLVLGSLALLVIPNIVGIEVLLGVVSRIILRQVCTDLERRRTVLHL